MYPVTATGVVPVPSDATSSKVKEESAEYPVSGNETVVITPPDSIVSATTSSSPKMTDEADEETDPESVERSTTDGACEMSTESISREQTLRTWLNLVEVAEDIDMDATTQSFAGTVADIVEWWRAHSEDGNPTSHYVDFGVGSPINLLMILALLPERYQNLICIEDERRSPSCDGENLSWLHEQTTDLLVRLGITPDPASMLYGQGIASMIRENVDEGWRAFTGRSWLEDQIHLQSHNELECDLYRFPAGAEKIVFLFNPTEVHWTVVEVSIDDDDDDDNTWTYALYNSLSTSERGATWRACQEQFPLLEQLICRASGYAEPRTRKIVIANSAQQDNGHDCGPIAIYNAVELLEGRTPCTDVDPEELRLKYLSMIRDALYLLDEGLEPRAFRIYMRKVSLDYLP